MTSKTKNQPAATLRDGALKATVWANPGKNGKTRYSIDLSRSYTDESGAWKDTTHFSPNELLRVARLAGKAYDEVATIRSSETNPAGGSQ